jgi:hypothetical protein
MVSELIQKADGTPLGMRVDGSASLELQAVAVVWHRVGQECEQHLSGCWVALRLRWGVCQEVLAVCICSGTCTAGSS